MLYVMIIPTVDTQYVVLFPIVVFFSYLFSYHCFTHYYL